MAHSTPTDITNMGDAWRLTTAAGAWILELVEDERLEPFYLSWSYARSVVNAKLAGLPDESVARLAASWVDLENEATARFLRERLGFSTEDAAWCAPALAHAWECRVTGQQFAIPVRVPKELPIGKHPRADGADIVRNVGWLYRHTVKQPPETVHDLAREYADVSCRFTDARSVVQGGIAQAKALLTLIARDGLVR